MAYNIYSNVGGHAAIAGNLITDRNLLVSGSSTLGDATSDVATVTGQLTASNGACHNFRNSSRSIKAGD